MLDYIILGYVGNLAAILLVLAMGRKSWLMPWVLVASVVPFGPFVGILSSMAGNLLLGAIAPPPAPETLCMMHNVPVHLARCNCGQNVWCPLCHSGYGNMPCDCSPKLRFR